MSLNNFLAKEKLYTLVNAADYLLIRRIIFLLAMIGPTLFPESSSSKKICPDTDRRRQDLTDVDRLETD